MHNHTFAQLLKEEDDPMANWSREDFEKNDIWSYGIDAASLQEGLISSGLSPKEAQEMTIRIWQYLGEMNTPRSPVVWEESKRGYEFGNVYDAASQVIPDQYAFNENRLIQFYSDKIWPIVSHDNDL